MLSQKLALAAAGNAASGNLYADDVFSVTLRDGTGSTGTITNGIDLAAEGGMIWTKRRNTSDAHTICDSARGKTGTYYDEFGPDNNYASQTNRAWGVTSFNSDGYSFGGTDNQFNGTGSNYVDWVFRKAPGFFDCVTYTGDGQSGRTVAHSLGSVPGCIVIKRTDSSDGWGIYHKNTEGLFSYDPANNLATFWNSTNNASGSTAYWNDTTPTSTVFTLGNNSLVNGSGMSYVAYIFASESPVFGENGDESIIKCGGYTGNGTSGSSVNTINLGFEPQWLMIKRTNGTGNWLLFDTMRGFHTVGVLDEYLYANSSAAGAEHQYGGPTASGFQVEGTDGSANANGGKYIYVAIRRSHKPPTAGTDVFAVDTNDASYSANTPSFVSNFPVDLLIRRNQINNSDSPEFATRITRQVQNITSIGSKSDAGNTVFDYSNGAYNLSYVRATDYAWMFKRAAKFLDIVPYTGNGVQGRNIAHNLGVAPDLMIVKNRDTSNDDWQVYVRGITYQGIHGNDPDSYGNNPPVLKLNSSDAPNFSMGGSWDHTHPTASVFTVGDTGATNGNGENLIAYLFASLDGISKIGTYAGTGSAQNIDCGFTNGARFVLIKRVDSSDNWHLFDTTQGINSGNDPYYRLDLNSAQVTGNDFIDPLSSGFKLDSSDSGTNGSGADYIFFAIA